MKCGPVAAPAKNAHAPCSDNDPSKAESVAAAPSGSALDQPIGPNNPPQRDPEPTQVVRQHPINPEIMAMNRAYWALPEIRVTVWVNYMLVVAQWPTVTQLADPQNDGRYLPDATVEPNTAAEPYQLTGAGAGMKQNLANTTMETHFQAALASCMACHHLVSNALGRDFGAIMAFDAN